MEHLLARRCRGAEQNHDMGVESRAVAAVLTVLMHLTIVVALVRVTSIAQGPSRPISEHELSADKLRGAGEQVISVDIGPGLATQGLACAGTSYIGVGITVTPGSERIVLVGDDTPAARAGLQRDDVVLNPAVWRDAHREGAVLRVRVLREGVEMALPVLVGKICIG